MASVVGGFPTIKSVTMAQLEGWAKHHDVRIKKGGEVQILKAERPTERETVEWFVEMVRKVRGDSCEGT